MGEGRDVQFSSQQLFRLMLGASRNLDLVSQALCSLSAPLCLLKGEGKTLSKTDLARSVSALATIVHLTLR